MLRWRSNLKTAFIICTRLNSSRLPGKPLLKLNGITVLEHLCSRLHKSKIPIILAIPMSDYHAYNAVLNEIPGIQTLYVGNEHDPLERMYSAARDQGIDHVIRVTHDKIFVDHELVLSALDQYLQMNLDYLYSSKFTDGSGFEIISFTALEHAAKKFKGKNTEYISYAIRAVTDNKHDFDVPQIYRSDARLLIDYPEDMQLLNTIFSLKSDDCSLFDALRVMQEHKWMSDINRLPDVSIYTCVYNGAKYLEQCMGSVAKQKGFKDFEYIIVDDASTDKSYYLASKFASLYPNVTIVKNDKNLGLATSSNVALKHARAKYIMRLDADDYLISDAAVRELHNSISRRGLEAVYPNNYYGSLGITQNGKDAHHVGGAIFSTRAINHIRFTDGLRNYEGLDLWQRAKEQLKIGYVAKPLFFYRQSPGSMSKTNLAEREKTKKQILEQQP